MVDSNSVGHGNHLDITSIANLQVVPNSTYAAAGVYLGGVSETGSYFNIVSYGNPQTQILTAAVQIANLTGTEIHIASYDTTSILWLNGGNQANHIFISGTGSGAPVITDNLDASGDGGTNYDNRFDVAVWQGGGFTLGYGQPSFSRNVLRISADLNSASVGALFQMGPYYTNNRVENFDMGNWGNSPGITKVFAFTSTDGGNNVFEHGITPGVTAANVIQNAAATTRLCDVSGYNASNSCAGAAAPTVASCGTSPIVGGGSTSASGQIQMGTGSPTTCAVTFGQPYPNYAYCTVNFAVNVGTVTIPGNAKTGFTVNISSGTSSATFNYTCQGN